MSNLQDGLTPVAAVRPLAPYMGGKRNLAKRLIERISAVSHTTYAEVFVGMGGVFFRRDLRPACEVINDWSEDVSTFFRVLQRHYVPFMEMLRWQVTSRAGFEKLLAMPADSLTDLERSARFLYLQRIAFGGKVTGRNFGVALDRPARFDISKVGPMIEAAHERLSGVVIERLPWSAFVARYDRPGTLFYLDPPYHGCEADYGEGMFTRDQFAAMADQLRGIAGRFILSINDTPEIRGTFAGFNIEPVGVRYTVGGTSNAHMARELIISN
ncbi:DNA adenine methylase [Novosphingobium sp. FSY-8]|uniref:site-specific DNA-methyltransferase (adenine-specific) n=1 Tax=Novosphingobium ovatum TaxID=1908523 RepID=A0ABW9XAL1_9SPHN|nr:DNA adenine methylase [Novosphingobium ovatum]NBC35561.1 DNA adenine methylase [Novosphingobium ovatum]